VCERAFALQLLSAAGVSEVRHCLCAAAAALNRTLTRTHRLVLAGQTLRRTPADVLASFDHARQPQLPPPEVLRRSFLDRHARSTRQRRTHMRSHSHLCRSRHEPAPCLQRAAVYGVVSDPDTTLCVRLLAACLFCCRADTFIVCRGSDAPTLEHARELAAQQLLSKLDAAGAVPS
jgi:hypothetical protein